MTDSCPIADMLRTKGEAGAADVIIALVQALQPFKDLDKRSFAEIVRRREVWVTDLSIKWGYIVDVRNALNIAHKPVAQSSDVTQIEPSAGWIYDNPDTGVEFSDNHPVESGEVPDANNVRPANVQNLKRELINAWKMLKEPKLDYS